MDGPPSKMNCPRPQEPFNGKKFLNNGCYKHDVSSCEEVLDALKMNKVPAGMTPKEAGAALDMLAANTYMARDGGETLYSLNECVIPSTELQTLGIFDCKFGNVELQSTNEKHSDIIWTHPTGCVISEANLHSQLPEVMAHITKTFQQAKDRLQQNINTGISDNMQATQTAWANYGTNNTNTAGQKWNASDARRRTRELDDTALQQLTEELRAAKSAKTHESKANHNQSADSRMMRDCRLEWTTHRPCGWGWKANYQYQSQSAQNGGRQCPPAQTHWWYGHQSCWEWRWVPYHEWRWYWWYGWHYSYIRHEWRVVQTH